MDGSNDLGGLLRLMKKLIGLIAICASVAMLASPALADKVLSNPDEVQDQCTPENKLAWYNEFRAVLKTDQAKAYELAKKWLACPEVAGEEQITVYLKDKFVAPYEKAKRKDQVSDLVYNKKDYAKAFEVGKAILADEPENLKVMIDLAYAGFAAATAKNESFNADAINYAKKAMQLIESGKKPDDWTPYTGPDEALAYLNNIIGQLTVQKNPTEALPYLIKVAKYESKLKKLPFTYATIAAAYESGPYAKLSEEYKTKYGGKDETPESKLALENINQIIDRMIDAYARAVALAGTDPAQQAAKKEWMESLSSWYKYRHNQSDAGLTEVIASVLSKPLPPEPTPLTTLPTPAPAATPTAGAASTPATTPSSTAATGSEAANKPEASTNTAPATSGAATQPSQTTAPATTTKPAASSKPTPTPKPKIKKNHRGH
jgi:hypothetical protein